MPSAVDKQTGRKRVLLWNVRVVARAIAHSARPDISAAYSYQVSLSLAIGRMEEDLALSEGNIAWISGKHVH